MSEYFKEDDYIVAMRRRKEYGVVRLVGMVDSASIFHILDMIEQLVSEHYNEVVLELTSPGGELSALQRFISSLTALRDRNIRLITQAYDHVASAAAIMLSAGDVRLASRNCSLVYHFSRITQAQSVTARNAAHIASRLNELDSWIIDRMVQYTGWTREFIKEESDNDRPTDPLRAECFNFIDMVGDYRDPRDLTRARIRSQGDVTSILDEVGVNLQDAPGNPVHSEAKAPDIERRMLHFARGRLPRAIGVEPTPAWTREEESDAAIRNAFSVWREDRGNDALKRAEAILRSAIGGPDSEPAGRKGKPATRDQEAGVMHVREFRDLIPETGEIDQAEITRHYLALGETGSGKTKSMVEPLIKGLVQFRPRLPREKVGDRTSLFVVDPKNELYEYMESLCRDSLVDNENLVRIVLGAEESGKHIDGAKPVLINFDGPPDLELDERGLPGSGTNFERMAQWIVEKAASLDPTNILNGEKSGTTDFSREAARELKEILNVLVESLMWFRRYPERVEFIWNRHKEKSRREGLPLADDYVKFLASAIVHTRQRQGEDIATKGDMDVTNSEIVHAELQWMGCRYLAETSAENVLGTWKTVLESAGTEEALGRRISRYFVDEEDLNRNLTHSQYAERTEALRRNLLGIVECRDVEMKFEMWPDDANEEEQTYVTTSMDIGETGTAELSGKQLEHYRSEAEEWIRSMCTWWNGITESERNELFTECLRRVEESISPPGYRVEPGSFLEKYECRFWDTLLIEGRKYRELTVPVRMGRDEVRRRTQDWVMISLFRLVWDVPMLEFWRISRVEIVEEDREELVVSGRWMRRGNSDWRVEFPMNGRLDGGKIIGDFRREAYLDETTRERWPGLRSAVGELIENRWLRALGIGDQSFFRWLVRPNKNVFSVILDEICPLFSSKTGSDTSDEPTNLSVLQGAVDEISLCLEQIDREVRKRINRGPADAIRMLADISCIERLRKRLGRLGKGSVLASYKGDAISGTVVQAIHRFAGPLVSSTIFFGMDFGGDGRDRTRIDQIIEDPGTIVVFSPSGNNMTDSEELVVRAGKAKFFEKVLVQESRMNILDRSDGAKHLLVYVADEFQRFITVGDDHGEQSFIDRCRSYGVSCVFATQSLASLRYKLGNVSGASASLEIVLANIGTKAFFRSTDREAMGYLTEMVGQGAEGSIRGLPMLEPGACWFLRPNGAVSRRRVVLDRGRE